MLALAAGGESYIVDSCTMLDWKAKLTGADPNHPVFQEEVWKLFRRRLLNISTTIAKQLKRRSPRLSAEIKKRRVKIIIPDKVILRKASEMMKRYEEEGRITGNQCVDLEDLEIILTAKHFGLIVITEEAQGLDRWNIPTVCREPGVRCMSSAQLLAKLGL